MADKKKNAYEPRFDFGSNLDPDGTQTGTIKDLLAELNNEINLTTTGRSVHSCKEGATIDDKSLGRTLDFVYEITGQRTKGTTSQIPLSTLKTIKLLYTQNDNSDTQLFRRIARPGKPTQDFRITGRSLRNEKTFKLVNALLNTISLELSKERSKKIETSLLTLPQLLECIERENFEILEPIYANFAGNSEALANAFRLMARAVASYRPHSWVSSSPLHEKIYIYLHTLPFFHYVGELKENLETAEIDWVTYPAYEQIDAFCKELSERTGEDIRADTPITSIEEFPDFLSRYSLPLGKLVKHVTGIHSERRDLLSITDEARKVLHAYVFHQWHRTPAHVTNLTAADCVAALCAIRHQQKVKTNFTSSWVGQESGEQTTSRLLSHLDPGRSIDELYVEDYIPPGAMQILYYRFCGFHSKIIDIGDRHDTWLDFQLARLQRYSDCFLYNDIDLIDQAVDDFNIFCEAQAYQVAFHAKKQQ